MEEVYKLMGIGTVVWLVILSAIVFIWVIYQEFIKPVAKYEEVKAFFGYTDEEMKRKIWYSIWEFLGSTVLLTILFLSIILLLYLTGSILNMVIN